MSLNNIDTKQVKEFKTEIQADPNQAKFTARIEGDWLFEEGIEPSEFCRPRDSPRAYGIRSLLVCCMLHQHVCNRSSDEECPAEIRKDESRG